MLADDFSFLGQNVLEELAKLGLVPPPRGSAVARGTSWVYRPTVMVSGESQPDERLLSAAKVCRSITLCERPDMLSTCPQPDSSGRCRV